MNEETIEKIISKYKMYMSFDGNEYEMIQKRELNKLLDYIQQKENIIKEVREYANTDKNCVPKHIKDYINNLLDKEVN